MNMWLEFERHIEAQESMKQILGLLSWDQETYMPVDGITHRAKQSALLSGILHEKKTSPEFYELILKLIETTEHTVQRAALQKAHKSFLRAKAVPKVLVEAMSSARSRATQAWSQAKESNNARLFLPALKEIITLTKEYAQCFDGYTHMYDALLDDYDPGLSVQTLEPIFLQLKENLTPYVQNEIQKKQPQKLEIFIPKESLQKINLSIIEALGFNTNSGRLDISTHPFTIGMSPKDVRLTTCNLEEDLLGTISGTIHECGHGIYEQGLPSKLQSMGLCTAPGCGLHESQSRFYENIIGKSHAFFQWLTPIIYRESGIRISPERLFCAANRVSCSPIRIYADESTYNLHILIRYQIEKAIIEDQLVVEDIPQAWNEAYKRILNLTPENHSLGFLQDIHWSSGLFGYFPSYTMGNLYASSMRYALEEKHPDVWSEVQNGNFTTIKSWLNQHIHTKGHTTTQEDIVCSAVGNRNYVLDLLSHLKQRHQKREELSKGL